MKEYYFISGLPRSGSTLLCSILRQNPDFYADVQSSLESITGVSIEIITNCETNSIFLEENRKNLMYGIFDGYYKHVNKKTIFDNNRSWTKKTSFLRHLFPNTKILCTVRDIISILNSFELIESKNPFYSRLTVNNSKNVYERCEEMMEYRKGVVGSALIYLNEGYSLNPDMIHLIEYDELCKNPEKTMRKVYGFLKKPYYPHNFEKVEYYNETYDRACNLLNLHTVRKRVEYNPPKCVLPLDLVNKYQKKNMEFWRFEDKINSPKDFKKDTSYMYQ